MGIVSSCLGMSPRPAIDEKYAVSNRYKAMPRTRSSSRPKRKHYSERRIRRMYPYHPRSSIRYVLVDIPPRSERQSSRDVCSRSRNHVCQAYVQLYDGADSKELTRQDIEEQLHRNLAVARHNAEIASRPTLERQRHVHFGSVTNIC